MNGCQSLASYGALGVLSCWLVDVIMIGTALLDGVGRGVVSLGTFDADVSSDDRVTCHRVGGNWAIRGQEWYIEQQVALKTSFGPRKSEMWQ